MSLLNLASVACRIDIEVTYYEGHRGVLQKVAETVVSARDVPLIESLMENAQLAQVRWYGATSAALHASAVVACVFRSLKSEALLKFSLYKVCACVDIKTDTSQ